MAEGQEKPHHRRSNTPDVACTQMGQPQAQDWWGVALKGKSQSCGKEGLQAMARTPNSYSSVARNTPV